MKIRYRCNLVAGIASTLFGIAVVLLTPAQISLGYGDSNGITPRTIPYALGSICILLGIYLAVRSLVFKKDTVRELELKQELKAVLYMLMLLVYCLLFKVSFVLASVFLGCVTLAFLKCRKPVFYVIIVITALVLYALFTQVLHVRM